LKTRKCSAIVAFVSHYAEKEVFRMAKKEEAIDLEVTVIEIGPKEGKGCPFFSPKKKSGNSSISLPSGNMVTGDSYLARMLAKRKDQESKRSVWN